MNGTIARSAGLGVASLVAGLLLAGPALADGLPGKGRPKAPEVSDGRPCTVSANVGYTTDYVFRGISQSNEDAAVQGGVDFACGRFYIGTWGSSIAFGNGTEIDVYGGYRTSRLLPAARSGRAARSAAPSSTRRSTPATMGKSGPGR
jgi:hypothetical protein